MGYLTHRGNMISTQASETLPGSRLIVHRLLTESLDAYKHAATCSTLMDGPKSGVKVDTLLEPLLCTQLLYCSSSGGGSGKINL